MKILEFATARTHDMSRNEIMQRASEAAQRVADVQCDDLVSGRDVAWLIAAALVRKTINGGEPKVHQIMLDDGVHVIDKMGG